MQLTTDELDEATLEKVRAVLIDAGRAVREVSVSRSRLEDLFLRIVREAQDQRVTTGGAVAGGQVAQFLQAQESDATHGVIDELVRAAQPEPPPPLPAAPVAPPPLQPTQQVLQELVAPVETPVDSPAAAPIDAPQADQAVLDSLIRKDDEESP
jgi:hypothetical protein